MIVIKKKNMGSKSSKYALEPASLIFKGNNFIAHRYCGDFNYINDLDNIYDLDTYEDLDDYTEDLGDYTEDQYSMSYEDLDNISSERSDYTISDQYSISYGG